MSARPLTLMLVAAEASGDERGAGLARALRRRLGEGVRFVGVGGAAMAAEGVVSPFDIAELSVLGLLEGLMAYPQVVRRADETWLSSSTTCTGSRTTRACCAMPRVIACRTHQVA